MRLTPLSQAETVGAAAPPIERWLNRAGQMDPPRRRSTAPSLARHDYARLMCTGGYPEVLRLQSELRSGWFESYVETIVERDLAALADIRRVTALGPLLRWTAAQTSQEMNLAAHLLGIGPDAALAPMSQTLGPLAESFVVSEIARQATSASTRISLWHYRDARREADVILERPDGSVSAIEVKASSSPSPRAADHLRWLRDRLDAVAPGAFIGGVVLHMGEHEVSLGDHLAMWPISSLWAD
ncbi:DUF4143 domain-containing protein [Candidatus Poriferisodalis sp.]|uniref:DUF4143 domain-containing protein n=1 Tax=Candidatus Poriferisodalis sp. TaxID=3101277 RepID=UPI003D0E3B5F